MRSLVHSHPVLLIVLVTLLLAAPTVSAAPKTDTVNGSARVAPYGTALAGGAGSEKVDFSVSARSNADGTNPSGTIRYRIPGWTEATAEVTCLWTSGNRAIVGGVVTAGQIPAGYNILLLAIEDNGAPGINNDLATPWISRDFENPATICAERGMSSDGFIALQTVIRGNVTVRDN